MSTEIAIIVGLIALVVLLASELTEQATAHRLEVDDLKIQLQNRPATSPSKRFNYRPAHPGTLGTLTDPQARYPNMQVKEF